MSKLNNVLDPHTLNQLGGINNMQNLMKQINQVPGIENLMKQMGGGMTKV